MRLILSGPLICLLLAVGFIDEVLAFGIPATREDCRNGIDDDGDGLIDLRDPDCTCNPLALPSGPELITNGGFEDLADRSECAGCISLFSSDGCPLGWEQESINLHTPCYISANPSINIGYVSGANGNYQGVGGYGRADENQRQQEEYLATQLGSALDRGGVYRFAANFALPAAELDGINEAAVHRIAILGSRNGSQLQRSPVRCYSDDDSWDLLATIEVVKSSRPSFLNYSTSFVAGARYRYLAIASDCCQAGEDTLAENLSYWAIDDVSLKAADPSPPPAEISRVFRGCDRDIILCAEAPTGSWTYQWYQDSVAVAGATDRCLAVNFDAALGQNYSVWIATSANCSILEITLPTEFDCGDVQPENCANGIDDDGDGLIDDDDDDCDCTGTDFGLVVGASPALVEVGESTRLRLTTSVAAPLISWSPVAGLSCSDCPSPTLLPQRTEVYTARVTHPENGCTESDSVRVTVLGGRAVYTPNVFSPNADGINDVWRAFPGPAVETLRDLQVFDRWGTLVFASPTAEAWEGRERPAGYYVFQLSARFTDGHEERIDGSILLVR